MAQDLQQIMLANARARDAIVSNAVPMWQPLQTQSIAGTVSTSNNVLSFNPRLVGLLCGFLIEVNGTLTNSGSADAARTNFGVWNAIDRIQFVDPNNFTRHNSKGYHFALLNSAKLASWFGGAVSPNLALNVGNINTVSDLATPLTHGPTAETFRTFYWVPISYSMSDLRGAIYSQIINATMNLQITVNATPGYTTGDSLNAMTGGANTSVAMSAVTVNVMQVYYDQLPRAGNQPLLPILDLSTQYQIQDTTWSSLVQAQDNSFPYANFRTFLSTSVVYDNAKVFNTGSDVSYLALQFANLTRQFQFNPEQLFLQVRNQLGFDLPPATYYIDHRSFPINTINYGNCELVMNPSGVTAGAFNWVGYEQFAQQQAIVSASSLPQGA